jgi:transcriptional regulatory protein GAL4
MNRGETLPSPVDYPTIYSAIIAQANLAMVANRIYNNTLSASVRRDQVEDRVAMELENQLAMWRASLPDYFYSSEVPLWFRGPRAVVLWKEQNLRLMLWHSGQCQYHLWHEQDHAADKCQLVAIEVINDISTFCKEQVSILHMGLSW